jgi:hypothetical protein
LIDFLSFSLLFSCLVKRRSSFTDISPIGISANQVHRDSSGLIVVSSMDLNPGP